MCDCDEVRVLFSNERERVARNDYECEECREPIPAGTKYSYWVGAQEDDCGRHFGTFRMCLQCNADWSVVGDMQYEAYGSHGTYVVYGCLEKKIGELLENGSFDDLDENLEEGTRRLALVKRWFPDFGKDDEGAEESGRPTLADGQPDLPL